MKQHWTDTRTSMRKAMLTGTMGGVPHIHYQDHAAQARAETLAKSSRPIRDIMRDIKAGKIHLAT